jgi:tRNA(Arg) A34 adenosine deaminase TadA
MANKGTEISVEFNKELEDHDPISHHVQTELINQAEGARQTAEENRKTPPATEPLNLTQP